MLVSVRFMLLAWWLAHYSCLSVCCIFEKISMGIRIRVPLILLLVSRLLYLLELVSYGSMPRYHTITALPLTSSDEP
jgi:hypothetical protein